MCMCVLSDLFSWLFQEPLNFTKLWVQGSFTMTITDRLKLSLLRKSHTYPFIVAFKVVEGPWKNVISCLLWRDRARMSWPNSFENSTTVSCGIKEFAMSYHISRSFLGTCVQEAPCVIYLCIPREWMISVESHWSNMKMINQRHWLPDWDTTKMWQSLS